MKQLARRAVRSRLFRYGVAGGAAFATEYGSFLLLYYVLHLSPVGANTISFLLSLVTGFGLQKLWVFGDGRQARQTAHQLSLYLMVALINVLVTNVLIHLFVQLQAPAFAVKLALIVLVAGWNFVLFKGLIFTTTDR